MSERRNDPPNKKNGQAVWRSLEEKARPDLEQGAAGEFAPEASELTWTTRRRFLELAGASLALAGATGCTRQPPERILPYVHPPEHIVPGKALYYATALSERGYGTGALVESHMGRPTKIEGNPDHPASFGASDVWMQSAILELYDPLRSQVVRRPNAVGTYEGFLRMLPETMAPLRARGGRGLHLLTSRISSPSALALLETLLGDLPEARWHVFEPVEGTSSRAPSGQEIVPFYDLSQADVILSLDSDFLYSEPGHLRYAREFAARRRVSPEDPSMNRLYAVEPEPSVTGSMADHLLPLRASRMEEITRALAGRIGVRGAAGAPAGAPEWLEAVARDLVAHRGRSLVVAGETQGAAVRELAAAMNDVLGNVGTTVRYLSRPVESAPGTLVELSEALEAGEVEALFIVDANPVYTAPADLGFAERLERAALRVHMGLYENETSDLCQWHLPRAHELASWGDVRAFEGTITIQQPLIRPLYQGSTPLELLDALASPERPPRSSFDIVRAFWRDYWDVPERELEARVRAALHDGVVEGTAYPEASSVEPALTAERAAEREEREGLEILFRPDPVIRDGRYSTSAWLQELPKPLTKITWDNAAHVSPATAERLGLDNEEIIEVRYRDRALRAPVWVLPGMAEETVSLHLGYGRRRDAGLTAFAGYDAYRLRTSDRPWQGVGAEIFRTGERYRLATTQTHFTMEDRPLIRKATLEEYREHPDFAHEHHHPPGEEESLYPSWDYDRYAWGMSIDLNTCIGCGACTLACQAENNIPVVGKEGVLNEREMHWIRVDRYYSGETEAPELLHQPVPCMHCENAPCEPVCPVAATVHSDEGLNEMVYNRCVGTRYCSNNCPYKVRRFNFLDYSEHDIESLKLLRNPDVTVRSRGVMEKCTYCVQRINQARIEAKVEDRAILDGEIETACQQACPTEAIVFGDVNDPDTLVSAIKRDPRSYGILTELNTRPRTTYVAKLTNRNPELDGSR